MIFTEYIPTELLKPFIKAYRIIENGNEITNRASHTGTFARHTKSNAQYSQPYKKACLHQSHLTPIGIN